MDRGYIELLGPEGISRGIKQMTKRVSSRQSGWIYNYAFTILIFTTIVIAMIYIQDSTIRQSTTSFNYINAASLIVSLSLYLIL